MKRVILAAFVVSALSCAAPDDDSGASEEQTPPLDGLLYYLNLKKLSKAQMEAVNGALVNKERRQTVDAAGNPVSLAHTIKLITSGTREARQAFLIQESHTHTGAMLPEHDRYMCTLLVFISREGKWELENNDMFNERDDDGATLRARPCEGFELSWEDELPVLLSTAGKVRRKDGKYVFEVLVSKERSDKEL